ncbi:bifunctional diguanylate cyclase/phosphodiesterase [Salicibibacter kimchii]|uniref:Bifunctional diguanylate cyclase/phosphodiesterase n=1 Tax=Salicibibacter kimchii TaxID=2099786 RepID=A0A345BYW9_9BACI|nr:bifunctional diguanylate cyclase/phosphodiesterase [Salicibibacter kimchii]AXF56150.1 bifunctional diguanylate cyclase/phosphodiesterase [Salicibibacter kimchii]
MKDGGIEVDKEEMPKVLKELGDIRHALDRSSILAITDGDGRMLYANEKFCEISKYNVGELLEQNHRMIYSSYHSRDFFENMGKTIEGGDVWQGELRNQAKDGSFYWVAMTIVPFMNEKGEAYKFVSIGNDITRRKQMEEEVKEREEKYRLITENSSDLISIIDLEGNLLYVSPSYKDFLGQDMRSSNIIQWIHEDDRDLFTNGIKDVFATKTTSRLEFRIEQESGNYIDVEARINVIFDDAGDVRNLVCVIRDMTERKKAEETIYHLAYHDTLTELPNRRFFVDSLQKEIYQATRIQSQLGVLFLDVDKFKTINDSYGHDMGDFTLIEVAKRIRKCIRPSDLVARIGGDELTILLTNISSNEEVEAVAERIRDSFKEPFELNGTSQTLSCSIGISLFPSDGRDVDELLQRADIALYTVKAQGRGRFLFFQPEMERRHLERSILENELRKAVQQELFYLEYQPKKNLCTGAIFGMEALVRWGHPELGTVSPGKFIPVAEETGLIIPIGEWVLREGCKQAKAWQDQGYKSLTLSVNMSVQQFTQNLPAKIQEILNDTGLEPRWLELEVTESIFADLAYSLKILKEIRALGVHISIDDFGTGYSSFSYIKHLPVDTLKIDASFTQDIHENDESQAIVKSILEVAKTLNIGVVAEGIERQEQLSALSQDGCFQGQGFLFSKPLSKEKFEKYLGSKE